MRALYIFATFLLTMSVGQVGFCQNKKTNEEKKEEDSKPGYYMIKAGESARFDGYLLNPEAVAQIYTKTEVEKKTIKLELENKLDLAQIEIDRIKELRLSDKKIQQELLSNTILAKDDLIQNKLQIISKKDSHIKDLESRLEYNTFFVIGSFMAGVVSASILMYSINSMIGVYK